MNWQTTEPLVYVPTYKRDYLMTLESLEGAKILERTALVVHPDDVADYEAYGVTIVPCPAQGELGAVRRWLMDNHPGDYMVQMDDDLRFAVRRQDDPTKFRQPESPDEIDEMFDRIFTLLREVPLVGVRQRGGANRSTPPVEVATRQCMLHGLNLPVARANGWEYRSCVFEDFDYTLQVLTSGYENAVLTTHVIDQRESQSPGGVGGYRTNDLMAQDALELAMNFPGFVKVVQKAGWRGMEHRTDVNVQWKRALASASRKTSLDIDLYEDLWWA